MKRCLFIFTVVLLAAMSTATAQYPWSQNTACPGWNNPQNFMTGSTDAYYSGAIGQKNCQVGAAGMSFTQSVSASQMATASNGGSSSGPTVPSGTEDNAFVIMNPNMTAGSAPANRDPQTGNQLYFVPTQFNTNDTTGQVINTNLTRSIRIGDAKCGGRAAALYYNMYVTTDNALIYLYYAIVSQIPYATSAHGIFCDPNLVIRILKQNAQGQWVEINDTMSYTVLTTPAAGQGIYTESGCGGYGNVVFGQNKWNHYNGSPQVAWRDWDRVAINLTNLLYENIRIEVMMGDCCYSAHWAYAYIAGECRPMRITSASCPAGETTDVVTLTAPRGLQYYEWAASEYGVADPLTSLSGENSYFTFRTLDSGSDSNGHHTYTAQVDDFRVTYRPNSNHQPIPVTDSIGNRQTFRCSMTTAIDPSKPYVNSLYISVTTTRLSLNAVASDTTMGSVIGGGLYNEGDTATITAIPRENYYFVQWNDGDTHATRSIIMTQDTNLTAYFDIIMHQLTVLSNDETQGTVTGSGTYPHGTQVTATATRAIGSRFDHWSDGALTASYSFTLLNDLQLVAIFIPTDIVNNYIHDTVYIHDTIIIHDTVFDTIYITSEGIDGTEALNVKVYPSNGQIVVEGAEGNTVTLYDVNGRMLATKRDNYTLLRFDVPASGTYMIKIGNYPARNVVVIR